MYYIIYAFTYTMIQNVPLMCYTYNANDGYVDYDLSWDLVHKGNIFPEFASTQEGPTYHHFSILQHTCPPKLLFAHLSLASMSNPEFLHERSVPDP